MKTELYKRLAAKIARDLFMDGSNMHADRLVLRHGPIHAEREGAGWSEGPMADRIEMILECNHQEIIANV